MGRTKRQRITMSPQVPQIQNGSHQPVLAGGTEATHLPVCPWLLCVAACFPHSVPFKYTQVSLKSEQVYFL